MITLTAIIAIIYAELIIWAIMGISRLGSEGDQAKYDDNIQISLIIPFRNEAQRIAPLLTSLTPLKRLQGVEIIFVDDHSEDATAALIHNTLVNQDLNYKIICRAEGKGSPKKIAITQAVKLAQHPWIVTLDADVELPANWLRGIKKALSKKPELLLGPICLKTDSTLLGLIQQIETAGISQLGRGKAGMKNPMVANGAHLAYSKAWFVAVGGYTGNLEIASGDDMFLLKKAVLNKADIHYLNDADSLVKVTGVHGWGEFFEQRLRWLGKSQAVGLKQANWLGIAISTANVWTLVLLVTALIGWTPLVLLLSYLLGKSILDLWLIDHKPLCSIKGVLAKTVIANTVYPGLILIIAALNLKGGYQWKGRGYKK